PPRSGAVHSRCILPRTGPCPWTRLHRYSARTPVRPCLRNRIGAEGSHSAPRSRPPVMKLHYVPLLRIQPELQAIPRAMRRFRQYLRIMANDEGTDIELMPLIIMNPMGRDHVTALLYTLLALDADEVAAGAAAEASAALAAEPGEYKAALVLADDLMGGGTNR